MLISSKSEYAVRAMMDIAVHGNGKPVGRSGIAERQQIPLPYLTQVLRTLVNGGLLLSLRGPSGGYRLSRSPEEISLLDIITMMQGPVEPASCGGNRPSSGCQHSAGCGLAGVWSKLQSANEDVLRETSLKSIISSETAASQEPRASAAGRAQQAAAAGTSTGITGSGQGDAVTADPPQAPAKQALAEIAPERKLDCIGMACPLPIVRISEAMRHLKPGQVLEVWADDEGSKADIPAWCMGTGNEFLGHEEFGKQMKFLIRKKG